MPAPYSDLDYKLNRAIAAYLISVGGLCGTAADIFPDESANPNKYPNTEIQTVSGQPYPKFSGDYRCRVQIIISESAVKGTPLTFSKRVGATVDALLQTDTTDGQTYRATEALINSAGRALAVSDPANNADMVDFTVQDWTEAGFGRGQIQDGEGCSWRKVWMFDCTVCGSNVD